MKSTKWLAAVAAGAMLAAVPALPAAAKHGGSSKPGLTKVTCDGPSAARAKLRLRPRTKSKHGGTVVTKIIKVNFEVDEDTAGVTWTFSVTDNGTDVRSGTAVTDATGEFEAQRNAADLDGDDVFTATASNTAGDSCTINATVPAA